MIIRLFELLLHTSKLVITSALVEAEGRHDALVFYKRCPSLPLALYQIAQETNKCNISLSTVLTRTESHSTQAGFGGAMVAAAMALSLDTPCLPLAVSERLARVLAAGEARTSVRAGGVLRSHLFCSSGAATLQPTL